MNPKTIVKILLPVFLIVFIVWNLVPKNNEFETKEQLEEIKQKAESSQNNSIEDLDNDGLLNWEEELHQTDPNDFDTDDDGVSDKDEIDQNRSPVVFGAGRPEDLQILVNQKDLVKKSTNSPQNLEDVNLTESLNSLDKIFSETGYFDNRLSIKDSQTESQIELKNYFNKIAEQILLVEESAGSLGDYLYSLYEAKATSNEKEALSILANRYKDIGERVLKIETPNGLGTGRSEEISGKYISMSESLRELIKNNKGYLDSSFRESSDTYTKAVTERNTIFVDIHNFVLKEKIYFSDNDPGSFFLFRIN